MSGAYPGISKPWISLAGVGNSMSYSAGYLWVLAGDMLNSQLGLVASYQIF